MKVVFDTPERLVLQYRPVLLSMALLAATLVMVYAALHNAAEGEPGTAVLCLVATLVLLGPALWFAVERVDVIFDAAKGRCTIRKRRMSGHQAEDHKLDTILRAMIQTYKSSDSDGADMHRVALVIGAESLENRHGLTRSYRSGTQAARTVERVNAWLDAHRD